MAAPGCGGRLRVLQPVTRNWRLWAASRASSRRINPNAIAARGFFSSSPVRQHVEAFQSQLEDPLASSFVSASRSVVAPPQTLTEKIVQRYAVGLPKGKHVRSGDYVTIEPSFCMSHDNTWPIAMKFLSMGATKIHNPKQLVMTLDHDVQNKSETNLRKYRNIEEFARKHGAAFFPAGQGIGHQIMVEEGYAWPGTLVVASDSHANMYGGISCLSTAIVRTDAASIFATGRTWWLIPPVAKVTFTGTLPKGVTGKDVIVALCGLFKNDEVLNHAIEFTGPDETLRSLSVDDRLAISNMTTEWGACSGIFPIDSVLQGWLRAKATEYAIYESGELLSGNTASRFNHERIDELLRNPVVADTGARYAKYLTLDLSSLSPYVSGPNSVKVATPLADLSEKNIKIDKAYLVSCTNSRRSDIAAAARVFKDAASANGGVIPKIADHVKFYISAASLREQQAAEEQGDWQTLLEAGAQPLPSGCSQCIGLGVGLLEDGDVGISSSNRNFKGRMGSTEAKAYLSSPEVVAASALAGRIAGPGWYEKPAGWNGVVYREGEAMEERTIDDTLQGIIGKLDSIIEAGRRAGFDLDAPPDPAHSSETTTSGSGETLTEILPGFPEKISGEIVLCDADNINTDAIYPGKYTYQDDVSKEKMAEVCMSNYDLAFNRIARAGDVIVSGFNFGTGSSREQAATAILAKGIPLVVAGSFGSIFSRNSINNALMTVEAPRLINRLREVFSASSSSSSSTTKDAEVTEPAENKQSLDSPPPAPIEGKDKVLTRRTGWTLEWDVRRSLVTVQEGADGPSWTQKVGELPPNVQEIIARGGLVNWVKGEINKS